MTDAPPRRAPPARRLVALAGAAVAIVASAGLVTGAVHGGRVIRSQEGSSTVAAARLDEAYYRCLEVQARSLVSPGTPVTLPFHGIADLSGVIDLLKAVGSWATFADPTDPAVTELSLRHVPGPGACLGVVVVARGTRPGAPDRIGSGASVPGDGPPPAMPL